MRVTDRLGSIETADLVLLRESNSEEAASEEQHRLGLAFDAEADHPPDDDLMISSREYLIEQALNVRQGPIDHGGAGYPGMPGDSGELIAPRAREAGTQLLLVSGEDGHTEVSGL